MKKVKHLNPKKSKLSSYRLFIHVQNFSEKFWS